MVWALKETSSPLEKGTHVMTSDLNILPCSHILRLEQALLGSCDDEDKGEIKLPTHPDLLYNEITVHWKWTRERYTGSLLPNGTADVQLTLQEGLYQAVLYDDIEEIKGRLSFLDPKTSNMTFIGSIRIAPSADRYTITNYPLKEMAPGIYWLLTTACEKMVS